MSRHNTNSVYGFSALQRAENSSIANSRSAHARMMSFSALQRAENSSIYPLQSDAAPTARFSALQRAENSSIRRYCRRFSSAVTVSVLFSEPKIPQYVRRLPSLRAARVSVLFSEPKIPQLADQPARRPAHAEFQCSSASRKFLNQTASASAITPSSVSVLFSEPKIPQSVQRSRK